MRKIVAVLGTILVAGSAWAAVATNAITINVYLKVANGTYESIKQIAGLKQNQNVSSTDSSVMNVTSLTNAIPMPNNTEAGEVGYAWMRNVGSTGDIYIANSGSITAWCKLPTGAVSLVSLAQTNLTAWTLSAAATGKLDIVSHAR